MTNQILQKHIHNGSFIHPDGANATVVAGIFHDVSNMIVDFFSNANRYSCLPEEKYHMKDFSFCSERQSKESIYAEIQRVIASSMNPANTGYIGHMDSLPTTFSIVGAFVGAAINNNLFSLEMSPYLTKLEYNLINQFTRLFGYGDDSSGVIVSGGTLSNIQAVIVARNRAMKAVGKQAIDRLVIMASEHSHVSLKKAAMITGIGEDNVVYIKTDSNKKMDPSDLSMQVRNCLSKGLKPFMIVATAGTTVTGNIDPIEEIQAICQEYGIWFHVDAIYGGALILSKDHGYKLKGIESADSISFNPQKWMHVAKTCSLLLFKGKSTLEQEFRMKASYVKDQNQYVNLSEVNIQGTKASEVLKLWLSLLSIGLKDYGYFIDQSITLMNHFHEQASKLPFITFISQPELNMTSFRLDDDCFKCEEDVNYLFNDFALQNNIFFSLPRFEGRLWQRMILLNPFLDKKAVQKVLNTLQQFYQIYGK
ncbi:MAG TPA: aminotransferase class V-fold PLP-dependent enzyme [Flavisolibacter sp.]|jgi:glutamate/tyrosine decarboxylase-like PLP-dependent enzyme|nr:aminotransferase class V-fold PLP-dependent enzyme [Flavisolibacter sp.]